MNLLRFFRNIYGKRIYFRIIFVILLALGTAIAQFLATKHLGDVIDAVEQGYEETMHQFLIIAVSMIVYIFGTAAFTFLAVKLQQDFRVVRGQKSERNYVLHSIAQWNR